MLSFGYVGLLWTNIMGFKKFFKIFIFSHRNLTSPKFSHLTKQQLALFLVSSIGISNEALAITCWNLEVMYGLSQGRGWGETRIQRELKRVYGKNVSPHTFGTKRNYQVGKMKGESRTLWQSSVKRKSQSVIVTRSSRIDGRLNFGCGS